MFEEYIPNIDLSPIFNILKSILSYITNMATQIVSMIFPTNTVLGMLIISGIIVFLMKDKISGWFLYLVLIAFMYLILSGGIAL